MSDAYVAAKRLTFPSGIKNPGDDVTSDVSASPNLTAMLAGGEIVWCKSAEKSAVGTAVAASSTSTDPAVSYAPFERYGPRNQIRRDHRLHNDNGGH